MHPLLHHVAHRPWPLPRTPWVMFQSWRDLLFAHWRVSPDVLRPLLPLALELDVFGDDAYIGIVPFLMTDVHGRALPALPGLAEFPELNVRTYVRFHGRPGVFFFSLDADSSTAVLGGRSLYRLPYHRARMNMLRRGDWIHYHSRRRSGAAEFNVRYRPAGDSARPATGTIEHFLTERYGLFTTLRAGRVLRADIHHAPWQLQPADAVIESQSVAAASGIVLATVPDLLHYAARQDTLIWPPRFEG